ncbi:hypothetical protein FHS96_000159 [Sphingomonas zeicaulis]|uniref:hypothetical protein n=1 Tax=Sphingomonas zeicaulis TaxID=1632740 RepID=UPI003D241689
MPVETEASFTGPLATNGVAAEFPFAFKAASAGEIRVLARNADGAESEIAPAGYAVTLAEDAGGTVHFAVAPAAGLNLFIVSAPNFTQRIVFENGSRWLAGPVNEANDRAALRDLKLQGEVSRALQVPLGETAAPLPGEADRAQSLLGFDAEARPYAAHIAPAALESLAAASGAIDLIAANIAPIGAVAEDLEGAGAIAAVAGSIGNVDAVGGQIEDVQVVAEDLALGVEGSFIRRAPQAAIDAGGARELARTYSVQAYNWAQSVNVPLFSSRLNSLMATSNSYAVVSGQPAASTLQITANRAYVGSAIDVGIDIAAGVVIDAWLADIVIDSTASLIKVYVYSADSSDVASNVAPPYVAAGMSPSSGGAWTLVETIQVTPAAAGIIPGAVSLATATAATTLGSQLVTAAGKTYAAVFDVFDASGNRMRFGYGYVDKTGVARQRFIGWYHSSAVASTWTNHLQTQKFGLRVGTKAIAGLLDADRKLSKVYNRLNDMDLRSEVRTMMNVQRLNDSALASSLQVNPLNLRPWRADEIAVSGEAYAAALAYNSSTIYNRGADGVASATQCCIDQGHVWLYRASSPASGWAPPILPEMSNDYWVIVGRINVTGDSTTDESQISGDPDVRFDRTSDLMMLWLKTGVNNKGHSGQTSQQIRDRILSWSPLQKSESAVVGLGTNNLNPINQPGVDVSDQTSAIMSANQSAYDAIPHERKMFWGGQTGVVGTRHFGTVSKLSRLMRSSFGINFWDHYAALHPYVSTRSKSDLDSLKMGGMPLSIMADNTHYDDPIAEPGAREKVRLILAMERGQPYVQPERVVFPVRSEDPVGSLVVPARIAGNPKHVAFFDAVGDDVVRLSSAGEIQRGGGEIGFEVRDYYVEARGNSGHHIGRRTLVRGMSGSNPANGGMRFGGNGMQQLGTPGWDGVPNGKKLTIVVSLRFLPGASGGVFGARTWLSVISGNTLRFIAYGGSVPQIGTATASVADFPDQFNMYFITLDTTSGIQRLQVATNDKPVVSATPVADAEVAINDIIALFGSTGAPLTNVDIRSIWMSSESFDFSVQSNRDAFCAPGRTDVPRDLGFNGSVAGIAPFFYNFGYWGDWASGRNLGTGGPVYFPTWIDSSLLSISSPPEVAL